MSRKTPWRFVALTLFVLSSSHAQGPAQTVSGTVRDTGGAPIADAVVFVQAPVPASRRPTNMEVVDQIDKTFVPGLLPITVGTTVRFPNHDQIRHHVYSFSPAKIFELPLYKGESAQPVLFDKVGVVKIGCNIHDWMSGIILVLPSPHFAVSASDGRFTLADLPEGAYTVVAWHARSKLKPEDTAQSVQVGPEVADVSFRLLLAPARPRPSLHGMRAEP